MTLKETKSPSPIAWQPAREKRWLSILAISILMHVLVLWIVSGRLDRRANAPSPPMRILLIASAPAAPAAPPALLEPAPSRTPVAKKPPKLRQSVPAPARAKRPPARQMASQTVPRNSPPLPAAGNPDHAGDGTVKTDALRADVNDAATTAGMMASPVDEVSATPEVAAAVVAGAAEIAGTAEATTGVEDTTDVAGAAGISEATATRAEPAAAPAEPAAVPLPVAASETRIPLYRVSLPPSATLSYDVRYSTRGSITTGRSVIAWHAAGDTYAVRGEITKFGFALSTFQSAGAIDGAGIAPALYTEKNTRRNETSTDFQRDARQMIRFSASANSYPLIPGAQDRASILWQLSGIARGDQSLLVPGKMLDVVVAGVRDAEHWRIEVMGEETIALETGEARAWHLVRAPRQGTNDKRIDIWLAPERQWYPVKLRYTEKSGDYLDLSLAAVR